MIYQLFQLKEHNRAGGAQAERHCEERSDEAIQIFNISGLLRYARNDGAAATGLAIRLIFKLLKIWHFL